MDPMVRRRMIVVLSILSLPVMGLLWYHTRDLPLHQALLVIGIFVVLILGAVTLGIWMGTNIRSGKRELALRVFRIVILIGAAVSVLRIAATLLGLEL
jgi:hypothetical protein